MPQPKGKDWPNGYKNKTPLYAAYKRPTSKQRDTYRLKVKGWKKIYHANRDQKKAEMAILISDKIDVKTKAVEVACIFLRLVVCQLLHLLLFSHIQKAVFSPCL